MRSAEWPEQGLLRSLWQGNDARPGYPHRWATSHHRATSHRRACAEPARVVWARSSKAGGRAVDGTETGWGRPAEPAPRWRVLLDRARHGSRAAGEPPEPEETPPAEAAAPIQ